MNEININTVFIGSCTNGRIEDLRKAAEILDGKKIDSSVKAFVVPGSGLVKKQAENEGLDKIFLSSGFEWRDPGCSMCLAMNSTNYDSFKDVHPLSNRNFEGRQGRGGRTIFEAWNKGSGSDQGKIIDKREIIEWKNL